MTVVGSGGVAIKKIHRTKKFEKDFKKLSSHYKELFANKLRDLLKNPRPPGLKFEKLKGYRRPDIFTIHLDGNYKASFEIEGDMVIFRTVGPHDKIDRSP
ncbi:type II toxin-antitoxin system RelE/ParE family toxin [Neptuniibacter sp.]|uniref:type II toxin-antitoxin system RelE family toxin n=1 Tax=Neptuniibacter sp. TaxID=1962643 RepID=UPI0026147F48|nr:type II toxin-antitoxin system RelE/ParE family toxin [Neptuniibacter sp.]MCP4596168.1 type II toxin-antitoxin system RelE/ParE family toxin [Neptuniibacter sp.]